MYGLDIGVYGARGIPSTYSGYETFLTVLLPGLVANGHQVTMYCRRGEVSSSETYEGVKKRLLPSLNTKTLGTLTHGAVASVVARAARHDVLLVVNVANALFCGVSRMTGQPVVLNTDGQEWLRGKWGRAVRSFFRLSARLSPPLTTGLVADCRAMAAIYENDFAAHSTVIPYCWTGLEPATEPATLARYGLEAGRYLCHAGRLIPENNSLTLAEQYVQSSCEWPLAIMGAANYDSPVTSALHALAARDGRVRLLGHVDDRSEYATLVQGAGAYIHTHTVGGINPSLVEAMGVGALILALRTPFNEEALGAAGLYFDGFDSKLSAVLAQLPHTSDSEVHAFRQAASDRARRVFSADAVTRAYDDLLRAAAASKWRSRLVVRTEWGGAHD